MPHRLHHVTFHSSLLLIGMLGVSATIQADDGLAGKAIYEAQCASCHGSHGEGTTSHYPSPLAGDRSVGELTEYIARTMPEDKPGTCVGDEARQVADYIHGAFYSVTAQARNKPARIELSRLTIRQYQNTLADLFGRFRGTTGTDDRHGLSGHYYKTRNPHGNDRAIERIDPEVHFDFADKSPDPEKMEPHEFSIRWEGSVFAPDSGEYEFLVRTDHSMRLWINDQRRPLVDAYVKSGSDTEFRGTIYLLGGRSYPLRLEFSKAKQGVDDKKAKERPPAPASISLEWTRPHRLNEVIPARFLSPAKPPELFVITTQFPPDDRSLGWEKATTISKEWDQSTTEAAIEVANYVGSHLGELANVRREESERIPKLKSFCERFVSAAFRRPLDDEQHKAYIDASFESSTDPEVAVKRVVLLSLKSPRFLYRELRSASGDVGEPYDVASRLSYTLWDSLPDSTLLDAAAAGQLTTREQVLAQAARMSSDTRARSKFREFLLRWLKIDRVPDLSKDPEQFPDFDARIADDLRTSLELFLDDLLASDETDFRQLLLSDSLYLNERLAKYYRAEKVPASFEKVSLEASQRAGILSHPYLLSDFAYSSSSSPIHRGVFIARSLLGRTLRPPPEAITPIPPQLKPDLTTRERVTQQTQAESCQSCHSMINPLGFTLESFDAVGRFRNEENGKPVSSQGAYRSRTGELVQFRGVRELADFLANSSETHGAFVEQLFHALVKQPIRAYGPQTKERLLQKFVSSNFNMRQLMIEIATTAALPETDNTPRSAPSSGQPNNGQ